MAKATSDHIAHQCVISLTVGYSLVIHLDSQVGSGRILGSTEVD